MKKRIILLNEIGLNQIFTEAFRKEGYEVYSILEEPFIYKKSLKSKVLNIFYRIFLNDKRFYSKDYYKKLNQEVYRRLKSIKIDIDYALIFRADYYSKKNIKLIRRKTKHLVAYQYDGWEVCSNIVKYKDYFDRIFFFDVDDLSKFGNEAMFLTNCYFTDDNTINKSETFDVFYIGTSTDTRVKFAENVYRRLKNYKTNIILTIPKYQKEKDLEGFRLVHNGLFYNENISLLKQSKCILDIKFDYHDGLSFRFFEALYYEKKVITNNESVKSYDFYHPNNIFVTDFENLEGIEEFLEKPYAEIDKHVLEKYGFSNWSRYVLDIKPYQEITPPVNSNVQEQ